MYQGGGQFQHFQQRFEDFTSNREILAASACALGGILIISLSLIGGAADVQFLERSGMSWFALAVYLLVAPMGYAIWKGNETAPYIAAGLVGIDLLLDIILSYASHGVFPEWLVLFKFLIFGAILQVVWEGDDDDEQMMMPPGQGYQQGPGQPMMPGPPGPRFQGGPGPRR